MSSRTALAFVLLPLAGACGSDAPGSAPGAASPNAAASKSSASNTSNSSAHPWFVESAAARGVDFKHQFGTEQRFDFPEIMGGGVALFDYDGDGDLDLYLVQSGDLQGRAPEAKSRLYRNRGNGTFEDVTEAAHVGATNYGIGCAVGDYDGDGDLDLYVTGVGRNVLFQNQGDGTFRDVTAAAGVADSGWSSSAAFVDFDGDGRLDLFVVHYIRWTHELERECRFPKDTRDYCNPNSYAAPAVSTLFRNRGDGTFENATEKLGLAKTFGNGLGIACGDFDRDGRIDVYIANDLQPNILWCAASDGTLVDRALLLGCSLSGSGFAASGMGVQAVDLDGDGDLDLFVTNLRRQSNTLYLNQGKFFVDATAKLGLSAPSLPYTAFGVGFQDFDLDGRLDLYIANGQVTIADVPQDPHDPYAQTNSLYVQGDDGKFAEVKPRGGTSPELVHTSRGAAFGDIDGDGDIDVVVANRGAAPYVLENRVEKRGHWVMFDVRRASGTPAIGAMVRVRAGGRDQWRLVDSAYSYGSASDVRVHFGLGAANAIDSVLVRYPDGSEQELGTFAVDHVHRVKLAR